MVIKIIRQLETEYRCLGTVLYASSFIPRMLLEVCQPHDQKLNFKNSKFETKF